MSRIYTVWQEALCQSAEDDGREPQLEGARGMTGLGVAKSRSQNHQKKPLNAFAICLKRNHHHDKSRSLLRASLREQLAGRCGKWK